MDRIVRESFGFWLCFCRWAEDLSYYDVTSGEFITEPGEFELMRGSSADDIRVKGGFEVKDLN